MPNKAISYVLYHGATVGNGYGNRNGVSIEDTGLLGFLFPYCLLFIKVMYLEQHQNRRNPVIPESILRIQSKGMWLESRK